MLRQVGLWGGTAAVVLALHLGVVGWLFDSDAVPPPSGLPQAIMIDLAPLPVAPPAAPDNQDSDAMPPPAPRAESQPDPEPAPEPEPEPAPSEQGNMQQDPALPELPELPELPPIEQMNSLFAPPQAVALPQSARPRPRPVAQTQTQTESQRKTRITQDREPQRQTKAAAEPPSTPASDQPARRQTTALRAPTAPQGAAPPAGAPAPSARQMASWQARVNAAVARHMRRTRLSMRDSATITIRFTLLPNGQVSGAQLMGSTGDPGNDAALNRQAARLPRLPPPPSGQSATLILPVRIN
ncbi:MULTISPECIES: TonB family protein [unclassified Paracoccus (in: a-proteobacteria)]|uniref:TonB family protein n=1 Tax=unclassified Paracoccus (in: a-proteobacteria) TaxID=2688777 RepID=UPI0012B3790F|nr:MULTISPECIES: TonB family protein [unclassified Paracoccus (in: a-proteobacteria)]UXU75370.1 TonB family protein [Paracoccus sp. SMMA_5]UXU81274.1 TonB family protein [Paracoccus sp. SMMA_5_TC]